MRVVLINTTYGRGGAAQITANLVTQFKAMDIDVRAVVALSETKAPVCVRTLAEKHGLIERAVQRLGKEVGLSNCGILNTFALLGQNDIDTADVLSLHNLHGGYFNFLALPLLTRRVPAVLTLHDMWAFTGHCVYSFDCQRWVSGCGQCPYPHAYQQIRRDASAFEHKLKQWAFEHSRIHFVAISRWIQNIARRGLARNKPVHYIPNGIDLGLFAPQSMTVARNALGLAVNEHIILYAAHRLDDPRKGFDQLVEVLARLPISVKDNSLLLVIGHAGDMAKQQIEMRTQFLGFISDEQAKAQIFAAADVFAFPTRADNLPIVLQECLACGLPMVSFDVGGVGELVRHEETGILVQEGDLQGFADGLSRLLKDENLRQLMRIRCRAIAENEYSLQLQAQRYISLFEDVVWPDRP